ncbi:MAG: RidA family protein [Tissierellia bacterium]|nr:RidA family protein [Tissierellia bacterium]
MNIKAISTNKAPEAVGPYSQGIKAGNLIFVSGQLPVDMETGELIKDDIKKATRACIENILAILGEGGASLENIAKITIYITDMNDFSLVNEAYGEYFNEHKPARACIEVAGLPKGVDVEIEAIAVI